jgi:peptide/nickel transport system permease protein
METEKILKGRLIRAGIQRSLKGLKKIPPLVFISIIILVIAIFTAIFGELIVSQEKLAIDLYSTLLPPAFMPGGDLANIFGTDDLGRDVLSRLIMAVRLSMVIAAVGALISAFLGIVLGLIAVHYRGIIEEIIMMLADVTWAMPYIILALAVIAIFGQNLFVLIFIIGFGGWEGYARLTRAMVLSAQEDGYVFALRSLGIPQIQIYLKHIFPNIINPLIVSFTVSFPSKILSESALSFLGLGVRPPLTSLGQMLGAGRDYLLFAPWITLIPGAVIFLITLAMSIIGDWVRDILDPTLR